MVQLARFPSKVPFLPEALHRTYLALTPKRSPHISQKHGAILKYGGTYAGAYFLKRAVFMPWDLPEIMGAEAAREGFARLDMIGLIGGGDDPDPRQPFPAWSRSSRPCTCAISCCVTSTGPSMAHSLEVRVPLVEHHLLREVAPAPRPRPRQPQAVPGAEPVRGPARQRSTRAPRPVSSSRRGEWVLGGERGGKGEEFGWRGWARRLYEMAFRPADGI